MKKILLSLCFVSLITPTSWSAGPGTTSANFLKAGQGVRPIAMGETYIALGDGLDTLSWNPAGLVQISTPVASFTHSFWIQDIGTEYLAYGMPLGPLGAFGAGLTMLHTSPIEQTVEDSAGNYAGVEGQASAMNIAFIGAYAQKLSRVLPTRDPFLRDVLVGASLRIVSESIDTTSVFGGGLDIGAIWRQTEEIKPQDLANGAGATAAIRDRGWRAGFVAQNLGVTTDNLMPMNFRAGAGYVAQEVLSPYGRATVALDALIPIDNSIKLTLGAEYAHTTANTDFAFRAGYKIGNEIQDLDALAGLTAGAGFAIQAGLLRYQLDYAFVPYGELGTTHRAQLTVGFLPQEQPIKAAAAASPVSREILPTSVVRPAAETMTATQSPAATVKTAAKPQTPTAAAAAAEADPVLATPAPLGDLDKLKKSISSYMMRIKSGMLAPIQFDKSNALTDASKKSLDPLGVILEKASSGFIVVSGFGGKDVKASEERAKAAVKYLTMAYQVDPDRFRTRAGEAAGQPKNSAVGLDVVEK